MDDTIEELTHSLLQGGDGIRKRAAYHPPPQRDLQYVFDQNGGGTKQGSRLERRFDLAVEEGTIQPAPTAVESIAVQRARFNRRKRKYAWLEHHSRCTVQRGKCKSEQCPGWKRDDLKCNDKAVRKPYSTHYKCVQCSMQFGTEHYFESSLPSTSVKGSTICVQSKWRNQTIG